MTKNAPKLTCHWRLRRHRWEQQKHFDGLSAGETVWACESCGLHMRDLRWWGVCIERKKWRVVA